jgi:hypothetical protein
MKSVFISYVCIRGKTQFETCIVLPMSTENVEELLTYQQNSRLVSGPGYEKGLLSTLLDRLAKLQGFHYARMISAEATI